MVNQYLHETWEARKPNKPGTWFQDPEIWKSRNLEFWKYGIQKNPKNENYQNKNVGGVWIVWKKPPGPICGHFRPIFPWTENKKQKTSIFCIFSLVGQWALFTRFGVMCWCHYIILWNTLFRICGTMEKPAMPFAHGSSAVPKSQILWFVYK